MNKSELKIYPAYFSYYISLVAEEDIIDGLQKSYDIASKKLNGINSELWDYRYDVNKWTVKNLILHLMDSERIFSYRALCISRGETISLPGFDENIYADNAYDAAYTISEIIEHYLLIRKNSILLFQHFSPKVYKNIGKANDHDIELGAIGCAILGHELHHFKILVERYGV